MPKRHRETISAIRLNMSLWNVMFFILPFDFIIIRLCVQYGCCVYLSDIHWADDALSAGPAIYDGYFLFFGPALCIFPFLSTLSILLFDCNCILLLFIYFMVLRPNILMQYFLPFGWFLIKTKNKRTRKWSIHFIKYI